ncbi:serpin family protein [Paenibacillus sp. LHD-38]|uniref:serpin family protein n=1 Tax=Paenibacillus sp. LHD-38 TaxID=3072143 RepID=UPI002810057E|nr:serpin family protein [Paenibacillus sp. LHD-38]MDQ8734615.1 serpin family protein [Paenibacillus sp. LHD-38]
MLRKTIFIAMTAVLLLTACGQPEEKTITMPERARLAEKLDPQMAKATNTFGLELAEKMIIEHQGENVIVSPVSIVQALSMTLNGAAGQTRDQIAKILHVEGLSVEVLNEGQQKLRELLLQPGPGIKLSMANSLWLQKGWPFRKLYLDRVKDAYDAQLNERNLVDPAVLKEMNKWVNKQTNGLIPTILDKPISEMTKFMLLNALYFDGTWKTPFEPKATKEDEFTKSDGEIQRIPFMNQGGTYEYDETEDYQAIRLPYGDGQMGMLVVLPSQRMDQETFTAKLLADTEFWTKPFNEVNGKLTLPKFRIEGQRELIDTLSAMGMRLPFDAGQADFSELADKNGDQWLFINRILHKTVIDVSEQGTEAAAVTLVGMDGGSAEPSVNFEMKVNRPFLFAIQDLQSGVLLFVGLVETP